MRVIYDLKTRSKKKYIYGLVRYIYIKRMTDHYTVSLHIRGSMIFARIVKPDRLQALVRAIATDVDEP